MSGLKLSDEQLAAHILRLVKELPQNTYLKVQVKHEGSKELVRWWHTPIDKQPLKAED